MPDKVIAASLKIDTGSSVKDLKDVNSGITDVKTNLNETSTAAKKTGESVQGTTGNFTKLKDQLTGIPGPVGQAAQGVKGLGTAFKALLANPVGLFLVAIVAVLALLWKAFTNSFEGAKKLEQIFAGLKAAGQALIDNLDKIGSAIVKVFSFDFSGAIDDIKSVVNAATDAYSAMADLTKEAQDLAKEQRQNDLEGAERAKKLAILREQASDDDVPVEKRKAALKELQKDAEENAEDDIDLARRVAENKIKQLELQEDGARKNADEINQIRIEQMNGETENANELRRINKQVTTIEKQEIADRKAAQKEAYEKRKEEAQKLAEFESKLLKSQQENELATITDGYEKELKALEFKIAGEKAANEKTFKDKQINQVQLNQLNEQLAISAQIQQDAIDKKYREEKVKKDVEFEKELSKLLTETRLKGITDARELEQVQLEIGYDARLQEAMDRYKDDQDKFFQVKAQIDEQFRLSQIELDEKNRIEDEKKKLATAETAGTDVLNDPMASFALKRDALQMEVEATQAAFDAKALSEEEYNKKVKDLADSRIALDDAEKQSRLATFGAIGNAFSQLSDIMGKKTALGKAFAVAAATISAIQSAISSFNSLAVIPIVGPALGAIAAAAAIASGIANVKKIVAVQVPGEGGGGASIPTPTAPAAPLAPSQTSTKLDPGTIAELNNKSKEQAPIRAFVVEQDSAAAANRAARLQSASVLGG